MIVVFAATVQPPCVTEYVRTWFPGADGDGVKVLPETPGPLHVPPEGVPPKAIGLPVVQVGP